MARFTPDPADDMTQGEASAAHLTFSHLPKKPDTDDGSLETPSAMPIARSLLTAVFMFFIAFAAWLLRWPVFTVAFCIAGVVFFVAFFTTANTLIRRALAREGEDARLPEPWQFQLEGAEASEGSGEDEHVAERVERLGGFLADPSDPHVRMGLQPLPHRRRERILASREREAEAAWEWSQVVPGFYEVAVTADDGVRLVGHELACAPASNRWLVFAHDYHGSWTEGMLHARRFADHGYNLLMPELRGHGASGGDYVGLGWLDRRDLVAWCRDLVARHGEDAQIVLMGRSLGATATCLAAGEDDLPRQVRAVVSDSAYVDTWNFLLQRIRYTGLEPHPTADFARLLFRHRRGGYDVAAGDAEAAVEAAQVPTLFLHGRSDTECSAYHAARLYMAAGGREAGNRLVTFPHAGHCHEALLDPAGYYGAVWSFLDPLVGAPR